MFTVKWPHIFTYGASQREKHPYKLFGYTEIEFIWENQDKCLIWRLNRAWMVSN